MPATLAAYSVAGEREQGTLEPLLTTPVRRQELILGKAAAVMIPTVVLSYTLFGLFLAAVRLFAHPVVASAVFHDGPVLLALFLLAPLVAGWAIVVGLAVSVRASEVRVAQQLGMLASVPILGVVALLAVGVIHPTFAVAVEFAAGAAGDRCAGTANRFARMFDRERLVTGAKAARSRITSGSHEAQAARSPAPSGARDIVATATLALSRKRGGLIDRNREWQIEIDGNVVGSIASQKTVEFPVEPGRHTLHLSSHRHVSPIAGLRSSGRTGRQLLVSRARCCGRCTWRTRQARPLDLPEAGLTSETRTALSPKGQGQQTRGRQACRNRSRQRAFLQTISG